MKAVIISLTLVAIHLELTTAQSMARQQPNIIINRHVPEVKMEAPRTFISPYPVKDYKIPKPQPAPSTTIVTDCSPSVCKNLANTLQLMIVCNLLQNQKGGSDVALQLAAPFLNEVISSPNLSCGCSNPFANPIPSPIPAPIPTPVPVATSYPNVIGQQSIVTGISNNIPASTPCANSALLSLLGLFNS